MSVRRNALGTYGARGLLAVSSLLLTPYLYRRLGAAGFGTWSVILTLTTVFGLLQTGFASGPVKYVAELRARQRHDELQAIVSSAVAMMGVLGVAAFGLSVAAAVWLDSLAAPSARSDFRNGLLVLGLAALVRFPCSAYMGTLDGLQRYDLSNGAWAVSTVVFAAGAVVAVEAGHGVFGVCVAYAAVTAGTGLLFAVMLKRIEPQLSLLPRLGPRTVRGRLARFSSLALLADSMVFVSQRMDVVVVAAIRNAAQAAPYAAAVKLQTGLQSLILPFVNMLMPMVSDLWARGQRDEVRRRLTIATRVAVQLTVPVALGVALFAHDIVRVWLGSTAPAATTSIVVVLMAVQIVTLATAPAERVLVGMGRVRAPALLSVLEGTANLSASALLVWRYGAVGAALGTLLTSALLAPVKVPLVCRALGYSTSRFVAETVGRGVAHSIPAALVMVGVFFALPGGAGRFAAGLTLGIVVAVLGAAVEVGPRRLAASLGGRNGGAVPAHTLTPRSEPPAAGM